MGGVDKFTLNDRQFICVEYPGRVKNIDRAIDTLGGQQAITAVHLIYTNNSLSPLIDH